MITKNISFEYYHMKMHWLSFIAVIKTLGQLNSYCYHLVFVIFFKVLWRVGNLDHKLSKKRLISIDSYWFIFQSFEGNMGDWNTNFKEHLILMAVDLSFFIIVTTIGLNIIFGIIVDTFSQLRDSKVRK